MPRFFFSCEGVQSFSDAEGVDLPDVASARVQAVRNAAEVLHDNAESFAEHPYWRFHVKDEAGRTVFALVLTPEIDSGAAVE